MRFFYLFLLTLIQFAAFGQTKGMLHQSYAEKYYFVDSIYLSYDNGHKQDFYKNVEILSKWAFVNADEELAAELAMLGIRNRIYDNNYTAESIQNEINNLRSKIKEGKSLYTKINLIELTGSYYWSKQKNHNLAFDNYIDAYNLFKDLKGEDFPQKREYILNLAMAFYDYEDYDKTIKLLSEAFQTTPARGKTFEIQIYNTLGLCYRKQNKFDSSLYYFSKIYDKGNEQWQVITAGNIGINYYMQKRYDEAIPLLLKEVTTSEASHNNLKSSVNSLNILSRIYTAKKEIDMAEQYIVKAKDIFDQKNFRTDYQLAERVYYQLHVVYTQKGDFEKANRFADSQMVAKDSFQAAYNSINLARAAEKTEYVQHKLDTEQLLNKKRMHELVRNALLAGAILLVIICILYINRQRLKQKKLEAEKLIAEHDLATSAEKLDSFRQSVQEKNKLIEHFSTELEKIKQTEETQSDNEIRSQLERATLLTDEQWDNFRDLFEKVHKGFFGGLKKKFPDLTQAEIRFLALTKMKLTSKEMASMLGISVNAIRMNRHRLRKKLELDKDELMEELVDDI